MNLMKPGTGLLILSVILLSNVSCKKKFEEESRSETGPTSNKNARIASVANYLTNQPAINFFDVMYYYCGYWGPEAVPGEQYKQDGYEYLSEAAANGFKVIRFWAGGSYKQLDPRFPVIELWKNNPNAFFQAFDKLVNDAGSLGIKLVPVLVSGFSDRTELDQANAYYESIYGTGFSVTDKIHYMETLKIQTGSGVQTLDCIANPTACKNRSEMRIFALAVVDRYKTNPTILYWEIGNEINHQVHNDLLPKSAIHNYIVSMSADIKAIDNFHMLAGGIINHWEGDETTMLNDYDDYLRNTPDIDIASIHVYEPADLNAQPSKFSEYPPAVVLKAFKDKASELGKILIVGETGTSTDRGWIFNNFSDYVMSMMLAKTYLKIPLAIAWNWQSKGNGYAPLNHPEVVSYSIDPIEDNDAISILNKPVYKMGDNDIQTAFPITGDFDNDGYDDFGATTVRGLWQVSLVKNFDARIPSQWLSKMADENGDAGGAPFQKITGDWDGINGTDIAVKSKDGRWFVAFSNGSGKFINQTQVLSNFGNENTDPGGAPFQLITGDWDGDTDTDIGLKSKDGRWFVAFNNGSGQFSNQTQWLSNFGNESTDPGGAPFQPITGDWDKDGDTDIGLKSRDGRWFIAYSNRTGAFINQTQILSNLGNEVIDPGGAPFLTITGDWDGDNDIDIGIKSKDGRWFIALNNGSGQFTNQAQWLSNFGDHNTDAGGAPFIPFTGDWDNDHKTDIGIKSRDGRWFIARSNGSSFISQKQCFE